MSANSILAQLLRQIINSPSALLLRDFFPHCQAGNYTIPQKIAYQYGSTLCSTSWSVYVAARWPHCPPAAPTPALKALACPAHPGPGVRPHAEPHPSPLGSRLLRPGFGRRGVPAYRARSGPALGTEAPPGMRATVTVTVLSKVGQWGGPLGKEVSYTGGGARRRAAVVRHRRREVRAHAHGQGRGASDYRGARGC